MTTISLYELRHKHPLFKLGLNPFTWYKQMRMTNPVSVDEHDPLCELFRYKDVQAVLADAPHFSVQGRLGDDQLERGSIATMDPPRHKKLRTLVSQAFTPRAIADLADTIRTITNELLDACAASDTLEFIHNFATPLPMAVIAGMLGVPLAQREDFQRWSKGAIGSNPEEAIASFTAFTNYMRELVEEKCKNRQDDLISALLAAQVDEGRLSEEELVHFCVTLLGAGFETTIHLLGNLLLCLDEHPEAREELWADPSLASSTVEEVLRFRPVVHRVSRVAKQDMEIAGKQIKAGHFLFAWVASANRDEEQWKDPDVFDIRRSPNPHLSFGYGIHTCLGAPLARLEAKIALEQFIERFKDMRIIHEPPLQLVSSYSVYGVQQLPLRVHKR